MNCWLWWQCGATCLHEQDLQEPFEKGGLDFPSWPNSNRTLTEVCSFVFYRLLGEECLSKTPIVTRVPFWNNKHKTAPKDTQPVKKLSKRQIAWAWMYINFDPDSCNVDNWVGNACFVLFRRRSIHFDSSAEVPPRTSLLVWGSGVNFASKALEQHLSGLSAIDGTLWDLIGQTFTIWIGQNAWTHGKAFHLFWEFNGFTLPFSSTWASSFGAA